MLISFSFTELVSEHVNEAVVATDVPYSGFSIAKVLEDEIGFICGWWFRYRSSEAKMEYVRATKTN